MYKNIAERFYLYNMKILLLFFYRPHWATTRFLIKGKCSSWQHNFLWYHNDFAWRHAFPDEKTTVKKGRFPLNWWKAARCRFLCPYSPGPSHRRDIQGKERADSMLRACNAKQPKTRTGRYALLQWNNALKAQGKAALIFYRKAICLETTGLVEHYIIRVVRMIGLTHTETMNWPTPRRIPLRNTEACPDSDAG